MKRRIIVMLSLLAIVVMSTFAQGRMFGRPMPISRINLDECYELSVDMKRLSSTLDLDETQTGYLQAYYNTMVNDINDAIEEGGFVKQRQIDKAIRKNLKNMKKHLNDEQFKTYSTLLTLTFSNNVKAAILNKVEKDRERFFKKR